MRLYTRELSLTSMLACLLGQEGEGDDSRGCLAQGLMGWGTQAPFRQPTVPTPSWRGQIGTQVAQLSAG